MRFDEIMQQITNGLTGEREHDVPYLQAQCDRYKTHDMAREILRACGRLMVAYLTQDQKVDLDQLIQDESRGFDAILEEVQLKIFGKQYDEALHLMENLIGQIEQTDLFADDAVSEYRCFNEFFEEALYAYYHKPQKTVRHPPIPFDAIYLQYGSLLIDMKQYGKAQEALKKAMRWNPVGADIAFEHAETYKLRGDIESFFHLTVMIFQYAFRPSQVARCYRNIGYYLIEKQQWRDAVACYTMSLQFESESENAMSELSYIGEKAGELEQITMEDLRLCAERYGLPVGAHPDVIAIAYVYARRFLKQQNTEGARYCLEIVYSLTDDEDVKKTLDTLSKMEQ